MVILQKLEMRVVGTLGLVVLGVYGWTLVALRSFDFDFCVSIQGCILTPIVIPKKIPNMNAIIEYIKNSGPTRYITYSSSSS